jgi:hypothetical protein
MARTTSKLAMMQQQHLHNGQQWTSISHEYVNCNLDAAIFKEDKCIRDGF